MKKLLLAIALLLLPAAASAQCTGIFPANNICGTTAGGPPGPVPTSVLTGVPGGSPGQVQYNNAGAFGGFTMAGDCTVSIPNITCAKVNGVTYGSGPATDTVPLVTASNTTTYTAIPNCPIGSTLNYATSTHLFSCNVIVQPNCPLGWFCVSNFANTAAAVTALNSAGGGTLYFDQPVTLSAAQVISNNTTIRCASTGVVLGTTATTANLFTVTGANFVIEDCGLAFTGTIGTKTAGYLIELTGFYPRLHNLIIGPYCFVCIHVNTPTDAHFSNITFIGNTGGAPAAGLTGLLLCDAGEPHIANFQIGASGVGDFYFFGISNTNCALDMSNFEIITTKVGYQSLPTAGQNAFAFMGHGYFDSISVIGIDLAPNGGTIGYTTVANVEIGMNGGNEAINIDNTNGSTGTTGLSVVTAFNYTNASGFGINITGNTALRMSASQFGAPSLRFIDAFNLNASSTGSKMSVIGNSFLGSTNSISLASVITGSQIMFNLLNGGAIVAGGNSTTNVNNNLP